MGSMRSPSGESVLAVPALERRFVQPALKIVLLQTFPFVILGFHSDNGSEFVNYATEGLLREFEVPFTRSRARRSNDNGLVESKNASVVRKQFGYGHIPVAFYSDINGFTAGVLAEHINFHRPCWFPQLKTDAKGRIVAQVRPEAVADPVREALLAAGRGHLPAPGRDDGAARSTVPAAQATTNRRNACCANGRSCSSRSWNP